MREPNSETTFPQWVGRHARRFPDRTALLFVDDNGQPSSLSYRELWLRACSVAARLPPAQDESPRAVLLFPPGVEFVAGFIGCQIAGWIPVPTCYPKAHREMPRLDSAASDCQPAALICDRETQQGLADDKLCDALRDVPRIITDPDAQNPNALNLKTADLEPDSLQLTADHLALLQYTSGSTSEPKGVMIRQRNLMANLESIRQGFGIEWQQPDAKEVDTGVFWLPFFHDMGLIGGILEPLYVGGRTILMSPRAFLQRPIRWLQLISEHRASISGAPNFAYQLCVDRITPEDAATLDLKAWRTAFSGAEPVLAKTIDEFCQRFAKAGFDRSAFYPCYGLAEATLLASGGDAGSDPQVLVVERESLAAGHPEVVEHDSSSSVATRKLISCGRPALQTELAVIDPTSAQQLPERSVGEIWLKGASIAAGYWQRDEENSQRFDQILSDGREGFFRTGDLGFVHAGEVYVTGRLKDVIIVRGRNLFPHDIELTVRQAIGRQAGQCAAMAVEGVRGETLAIVAELPRRYDQDKLPDLARQIRREVIDVHEVDPRHVLLVRQATVPLTSSGKIQRSRCRELFDAGEIKAKYRYDRAAVSDQSPIAMPDLPTDPSSDDRRGMIAEIESWMNAWLVTRGGVDPAEVDLDKPFADYGLDSMTAVEMSGDIEDWSGIELTPVIAWNYPTATRLSEYLVDQLLGLEQDGEEPDDLSEAELEALLDEIEQMPEDQVDRGLNP